MLAKPRFTVRIALLRLNLATVGPISLGRIDHGQPFPKAGYMGHWQPGHIAQGHFLFRRLKHNSDMNRDSELSGGAIGIRLFTSQRSPTALVAVVPRHWGTVPGD